MTRIGFGRRGVRTLIALGLPLIVLASGGGAASAATQAATVADLEVWVYPVPEAVGAGSGSCIGIAPGTLDVTVSLGPGSGVGPIEFHFYGFDGRDPGARIDTIVGRDESSFSMQLSGGVYCYSVANRVSIDAQAPPPIIIGYGQSINLLMTLS
jgi:hypothetical protein